MRECGPRVLRVSPSAHAAAACGDGCLASLLQPAVRRSVCGDLHMGKGKNPNISMRGELKKRAEMERMRDQMFGDDSDGFPVFTVYVRSKTGQVWYPGGSLKGDERSKALVESWRDNTLLLKDQYKVMFVSLCLCLRACLRLCVL